MIGRFNFVVPKCNFQKLIFFGWLGFRRKSLRVEAPIDEFGWMGPEWLNETNRFFSERVGKPTVSQREFHIADVDVSIWKD